MRVGGVYVGLGLGDSSDEVAKIKDFIRRKWDRFDNTVGSGPLFDEALTAIIAELQGIYNRQGKLPTGKYIVGVINLETKYAMDYLKRPPPVKPIIFTIEGHMSNPWNGPCAFVASILEQQGVCWWQPIGYDTQSIPFNNADGRHEFRSLLEQTTLRGPNGEPRPFPAGTPWGGLWFSQGAIVGCQSYTQLRNENHWRLKDLKRVVAFGNPWREKDVIAPWVPDPPKAGTQGISDVRMTNTPHEIWREHSRKGDLYTENPSDGEVGLNNTAVYKIIAENSWTGGPAGMLARVMDLLINPFDGAIDIAIALMKAGMFGINMGVHGTYDLNPCIDWMRGVAV